METVIEARMAARKLDPMIGEYEYKSYNPITKDYESALSLPVRLISGTKKPRFLRGWTRDTGTSS